MPTTQEPGAAGVTVVRPLHGHDTLAAGDTPSQGRIASGLRTAALPLAAVFACAFAASLAGALAIRALGRALLSVPANFEPLLVPHIFPYTFAPVIGCSVAFTVAFIVKKPGPRSLHLFLTVGAKFALIDALIAIISLPGSTGAGAIVTLIAVILYPLLIIPALLRFVPRPGAAGRAPSRT